jgi:hypothetical protein
MVFCCEERADVALLENDVGLHGALDRLGDFRIGGVDRSRSCR